MFLTTLCLPLNILCCNLVLRFWIWRVSWTFFVRSDRGKTPIATKPSNFVFDAVIYRKCSFEYLDQSDKILRENIQWQEKQHELANSITASERLKMIASMLQTKLKLLFAPRYLIPRCFSCLKLQIGVLIAVMYLYWSILILRPILFDSGEAETPFKVMSKLICSCFTALQQPRLTVYSFFSFR